MPAISFIIITYNSASTIEQCLDSINLYCDTNYEIIVVDNNSADKTKALLEKRQGINLIKNKSNLGFAKAHQVAMEKAVGDYLFLINPDVSLVEPLGKNIIKLFTDDKKIAVIGPRILLPSGKLEMSVRKFPTLTSQILIILKLDHLFNLKSVNNYLAKKFNYSHEAEVDQVMGAAFFTTKKVWQLLGGLDPRYFIWFEEVDYCFNAKKRGLKIIYTPTIQVVHLSGHSFSQVNVLKKQRWFISSLIKYFLKNGL